MKFKLDHDYHLHTNLSRCSKDPEQTPERLAAYALEEGLREIVLTNHFWDDSYPGANNFYLTQNLEHIEQALPLPAIDGVKFYFGCEGEMRADGLIGISPEHYDRFDFIIIPTTHLHMNGFTIMEEDTPLPRRAVKYVERFEQLLSSDLPFRKVGVAHLTAGLIARDVPGDHFKVLEMIGDEVFRDLFRETARVGMGVELNVPLLDPDSTECEIILRPYRIAHECGCRFYLGSDAHSTEALGRARARFERVTELLGLTEEDKFRPFGE